MGIVYNLELPKYKYNWNPEINLEIIFVVETDEMYIVEVKFENIDIMGYLSSEVLQDIYDKCLKLITSGEINGLPNR